MQISSRFTIALHIFACIDTFGKNERITSDFLSSSINVNPVIIRRILSSLQKNGLIHVQRGTGGATIAKPADTITLYDIFTAVECVEKGELFHFHENPNPACPVGKNIHAILDGRLQKIENGLKQELLSMTLQDVLEDTRKQISQ